MLEEIKGSCVKEASRIPNWQNTSVNVLANKYIDNENNEDLKSAYFSAILLKKWPYIGKHYASSKASGFSIEECYDMVVHGIQYALANRKWRDPENKLYNDNCGPDKVINRCIASARDIQYYNSNTQKRKVNFGKTSLDCIEENVKDCTDIISDNGETESDIKENISMSFLIEKLMKSNKILEALIINDIVAGDCFITKTHNETIMYQEEEQTVKRYEEVFKASKLINNLYNNYSEEQLKHICESYCISKEKEESLINLFKTKKNKFDRIIKATLLGMSKDNVIKEHLCF